MEKHRLKDFFGPPNENPFFALARDPLTDLARNYRRTLILVGTVATGVALAGIVPREFTTLGIALSPNDQRVLVWIAWLSVLYFFISFLLYAGNDYWAWQENVTYSVSKFQESQSGSLTCKRLWKGWRLRFNMLLLEAKPA